jgi:hypothetical protein
MISFGHPLCSGGFTSGLDWNTQLVHRWIDANPGSANNIGESFSFPTINPQINNAPVKSFYHNYKPLSDFVQQIDFNSSFIRQRFSDNTSKIECYYVLDPSANTYGWVHNLNAYWANNYYYNASHQNYWGCTPPNSQSFTLTGFTPDQHYFLSFAPTRWGNQPLPCDQILLADASGNLAIDLSTLVPGCTGVTLGCDTNNADFAFVISFGHLRLSGSNHHAPAAAINETPEFSIYPNPASGSFQLSFPSASENNPISIILYTPVGDKLIEIENIKTDSYLLSANQLPKGVYFVVCNSGHAWKIKKLIVQ